MKLKFKKQQYQTAAVSAVTDCFKGQPPSGVVKYRIDPGRVTEKPLFEGQLFEDVAGFKNEDLRLTQAQILKNVQAVQREQNLPISQTLIGDNKTECSLNLTIEMETGTGKTYCYIKTMFELNRQYGWSKFVVVVPSIAIREGVNESFKGTADHFLEEFGKRARVFIYSSKQLHNLESFSSDAGINVMIINVQAFAAKGKDARRIYEELDDFQSRRPIDVIKSNHPILILDEPQKMGGDATMKSLKEFDALMMLRYSATHKIEYNKIHRLDALDAYNQKLVKKITVRGIAVKGQAGSNAYFYLEGIEISAKKPPMARVEFEVKQASGIKRSLRKLVKGDNLFELSGNLDQYKGFVVSDIDARTNTVTFINGEVINAGELSGDLSESVFRRIQIREAIKSHFQKEQWLFHQDIKTLSLFFIDSVAKYRTYEESGEVQGEYAQIFEEEYRNQLNDIPTLIDEPYRKYLDKISPASTHNGYFSIDKKTKRLVDPTVAARGETAGQSDDVDAYDLILRNKEKLLSFDEPTRFIFSHSALREGWDNPNVFVICTLKHSDNSISRRQEVGRGLRIAVNQNGDRMDNPATVHDINVLTVIASESYKDFVTGLQKDISESLSSRPKVADKEFFIGKILRTPVKDIPVTADMAKHLEFYLIQNSYVDVDKKITDKYHEAKQNQTLAPLPTILEHNAEQIFELVDSVHSDAQLPGIDDDRTTQTNPLNENFEKKEFKELWNRINRKAAYTVHFDSAELISKCVKSLDSNLRVTPLQYTVVAGEQISQATTDNLKQGTAFVQTNQATLNHTASIQSDVKYDLIGKIAEETNLTRKTIARILKEINSAVFGQYKTNPEDFISKTAALINEQKATLIVEHLAYDPLEETHSIDIFTQEKPRDDFSKAGAKLNRHIYDYVFTQSKIERAFVTELDVSNEVVVYAKLPKGFAIPTPVGPYNPDWAISFKEGEVKHIYFVAETKGSLSSMQLREIEKSKIDCARKFFMNITSDQVKYDVVDSYAKLMQLVK
jgi:type III restriction enzyme